jgi:Flp pilus assembly protein TadG
MRIARVARRHLGTTMVESALILSVTFLILLALITGGLGVMRYQQMAALAREATRAASVRGGQYRQDNGLPAGTSSDWSTDVYNTSTNTLRLPSNVLLTVSDIGLDPTALTVTPSWPDGSNWPYHVTSDNGTVSANRVQVTITYAWLPEAFFGGVTLGSTSQMQITN